MQRIIIDTNVIVSALISRSIPSMILSELVFLKKVEVCLSEEIFSEYIDVLRREKFYRILGFKVRAEMVLERIREISVFYQVKDSIKILKDVSDNKFL
jgi:putative PIN family toxin of toxin-antitoxin system